MKGEKCYGGKTTEEIVQCSGVFLMLVLSFMIMCALMLNLWTGDRENAASKAELRLLAIKNTLTDCANAADTLAVAVRIDDGEVKNFPLLARSVFRKSMAISNVQLAPDGVVTYTGEHRRFLPLSIFCDDPG